MVSPHNICTNFPKFSLFFLANHVIFTSIIIKMHVVTLSPHNICITFPKFSLVFFFLIMQYLHMSIKMSIVILTNYVISIYLHVFPILKFTYMWILHVSCLTCGFGITPMWVLHFEVKGSKLGPTNVSFGITLDASIAYWVINTTCNTYLVFQFIIVLDVNITCWVISTTH